jgi:hypothetical protein
VIASQQICARTDRGRWGSFHVTADRGPGKKPELAGE